MQQKDLKFPVQERLKASKVLSGSRPKNRRGRQPPALLEEQIALGQRGGRAGVPAGWTVSSSVDQAVQMPPRAAGGEKLLQFSANRTSAALSP